MDAIIIVAGVVFGAYVLFGLGLRTTGTVQEINDGNNSFGPALIFLALLVLAAFLCIASMAGEGPITTPTPIP